MMADDSFDPRTWQTAEPTSAVPDAASQRAHSAPLSAAAADVPPAAAGRSARADWIGLALSLFILIAGALAAYGMRPANLPEETMALSDEASPSG